MDYPRIKITNTEETYKKKKKSNHPKDTKKFKHLKQTIQRKSRQAYWKYIEEIVTPENNEEVHFLPKRFWTYIKHKKSDKSGVAPLRKNGRLETDPINKANILNVVTMCSITLQQMHASDIGLLFAGTYFCPFLKAGVMTAALQSSGISPAFIETL
jgi:hypothetical protein